MKLKNIFLILFSALSTFSCSYIMNKPNNPKIDSEEGVDKFVSQLEKIYQERIVNNANGYRIISAEMTEKDTLSGNFEILKADLAQKDGGVYIDTINFVNKTHNTFAYKWTKQEPREKRLKSGRTTTVYVAVRDDNPNPFFLKLAKEAYENSYIEPSQINKEEILANIEKAKAQIPEGYTYKSVGNITIEKQNEKYNYNITLMLTYGSDTTVMRGPSAYIKYYKADFSTDKKGDIVMKNKLDNTKYLEAKDSTKKDLFESAPLRLMALIIIGIGILVLLSAIFNWKRLFEHSLQDRMRGLINIWDIEAMFGRKVIRIIFGIGGVIVSICAAVFLWLLR